jgi:2-isopropylmalate synthase
LTPHTPTDKRQRCARVRAPTEERRVRRIKVLDTTLRDGEQSPGIALRPDEKGEIALMLERLGVDVIETEITASSPG